MRPGQEVTLINPACSHNTILGYKGTILKSPFYDICRSQYDIKIDGDWEKLTEEMKGFHFMMSVGDYTKEMEYASRKIGIDWVNVSDV